MIFRWTMRSYDLIHIIFPDVPSMAFPLDFEAFPLDHSILSVPFFWKGGSGSQRVDRVGSELRSAAPHDFEALLVPQVVPVVPWGSIKPKWSPMFATCGWISWFPHQKKVPGWQIAKLWINFCHENLWPHMVWTGYPSQVQKECILQLNMCFSLGQASSF